VISKILENLVNENNLNREIDFGIYKKAVEDLRKEKFKIAPNSSLYLNYGENEKDEEMEEKHFKLKEDVEFELFNQEEKMENNEIKENNEIIENHIQIKIKNNTLEEKFSLLRKGFFLILKKK
jgi:hypothetical protein